MVVILVVAAADSIASRTDSAVYPPPNFYTFTPPSVGQSYTDPVFGERITRVTDAMNMGLTYLSTEYASSGVTNADDTYVRIMDSHGSPNLFSLPSMAHFRRVPLGSSSPSDYWWDTADPNLLYAVPGNRMEVYNVATDRKTVLHTFSQFGNVSGMGESGLSHNGNRLALRGKNPIGGGGDQILVYEFSSNSVIASLPVSAVPGFFDASITPSGQRVKIAAFPNNAGHDEVWDIDAAAGTLRFRHRHPDGVGHNDRAFGPDGREYLITMDSWFSNTLYRYDLETGARITLHHFGWDPGGSNIALHVSTNSMHADGWIYLSTYIGNGTDPDPNQHWIPYQGEILRIRWDGSSIERLAHNRTKRLAYWNQPRATVSTSGRYLFWASNYRRNHVPSAPDKYADVYMIDFGSSGPGGGTVAAPSNLQASGFADPRIDLTWTDNAGNEDSMEVLRKGPNDQAFQLLMLLGANATSYTDTGVTAGEQYCYQVVAHAGTNSSQPSNTACATPTAAPTPPAAPTSLAAVSNTETSIDLGWTDNASNEDAFEVRRRGPGESSFSAIATVDKDTTTYQDGTVLAGEEFCYVVIARNGAGDSAPSNAACATPTVVATPPAAPDALAAASQTPSEIDLGWRDNANNEDMFEVRRRGPGEQHFSKIATLNANATAYRDGAVAAGNEYCYEVLAKNGAGNSPPSNRACASPSSPPPPPDPDPEPEPDADSLPAAPTNLTLELVSERRILLTWADNADNETGFEVHRQRNGGKYRRIARLGVDVTSYTDNRAWRRGDYCYAVFAKNNAGVAPSNEVCTTAGKGPEAPDRIK